MLRDFVITLSLANLWFFNVWRFFLITHPNAYPYYHWKANPAPILLGTMLDVLLLSTILWFGITIVRRSRKQFMLKIARLTFLIMFLITAIDPVLARIDEIPFRLLIVSLIKRPQDYFLWPWVLGLLAAGALLAILVYKLIYRREQILKLSTTLLLILSPFVLLTFGQATSQCLGFRSGGRFVEDTAPPLMKQPASSRRVVWVIFDEMDFRLSFLKRPSAIQLPAFDRLRGEGLFGENAYPPGGDTILSLPSLITGRLVSWSHRTAANELMLTFADNNQTAPWSSQPNVFSRARSMGFNSALAGWFHPYCRIIGKSLTKCYWEAPSAGFFPENGIANMVSYEKHVTVSRSMLEIAEIALLPDSIRVLTGPWQGGVWRRYHLDDYENIHRHALALVGDPNLQLILIHYPIPHPPGVYDRSRHDYSLDTRADYPDNLELTDRALDELRQQIEKAGLWESTTLMVSSDHRLRADRLWRHSVAWKPTFTQVDPEVFNSIRDERVPFILKIGGTTTALSYQPPFNTVLSHDLILAIFSGELLNASDVANWLDLHRSIGQSPYIEGEK